MVVAGLIAPRDLRPYTDYWLKLFDPAARGRPEAYAAVLRRYVRVFGFAGLAQLLHSRRLIACAGQEAARQAAEDDGLIAAINPSWVSPAPLSWDQEIERIQASV
jgi:hypothetical protein